MDQPKALLLDFGGVIIPINPDYTKDAMISLGVKDSLPSVDFEDFETGKISADEFISKWPAATWTMKSDVVSAWNALLEPIPEETLAYLKRLKKDYKLYLVSNTNPIHIEAIRKQLGLFGWKQFCSLFEKMYFSYEIGERKPNAAFYEHVLKDAKLKAEDCLFVDDTPSNIEAAEKLGIPSMFHDADEMSILDLDKAL